MQTPRSAARTGIPSASAGKPPAPRSATVAKTPTVMGRLANFGLGLAHKVGLVKTDPAVLSKRMELFSETFLGQDQWLTPNIPLEPKEPEGSEPRRWQYPPGTNIQTGARGGTTSAITFPQLRMLGDYTLVRIIIERLKEALKAHEWDIAADDEAQGDQFAEDILEVKKFFEKPDRRNNWDAWLGELLEEILVIDALSIYLHRTRIGDLWAVEVLDGATIKPLIDSRGFQPLPPVPAYTQYLYGVPFVSMTTDECLYRPRNRRTNQVYGFSAVEQTIVTINLGLRRELHTLAQFTDGNIPKAFAKLPADWSIEKVQAFNNYWNQLMAGDPQNRARLKWIPGGAGIGDVQKFNDDEVFGLKNEFDEWLARQLCFAFGLSPQAFIQMTNRAVSQELGDVEAEYGFGSLKRVVSLIINEIIDGPLGKPWLQFKWTTDRGRLQTKRVEASEKFVKTGVLQIDEIRRDQGKPPLGLKPGIVTATGFVPFPPEAFEGYVPPMGGGDGAMVTGDPNVEPPQPGTGEMNDLTGNEEPDGDEVGGQMTAEPQQFEYSAMAKAYRSARIEELAKWERFALGRLEKGKHAAPFACEFVPPEEAAEITAALVKAHLPDEIGWIFATRRSKQPPLRLKPPRADSAARFRGDIAGVLRPALERVAQEAVASRAAKEASVDAARALAKVLSEREPQRIDFSPRIFVPASTPTPVTVENWTDINVPAQAAPVVKAGDVTVLVPQAAPPSVNVTNQIEAQRPAPIEKSEKPQGKKSFKIKRDERTGEINGIEEK